ncbi:MAG: hypothetical protein D3910_07655, partial [Candidatus Electrothrix sp. ATG2]|nr:hypothetical protein [Candidatus Electrothrix sp. ATG2]
EKEDFFALEPGRFFQDQRDQGGLAGTGWGGEDGCALVGQGLFKLGEDFLDWEFFGHFFSSSVAATDYSMISENKPTK